MNEHNSSSVRTGKKTNNSTRPAGGDNAPVNDNNNNNNNSVDECRAVNLDNVNETTSSTTTIESRKQLVWENNFRNLVNFKLTHGHCHPKTSESSILYFWCYRQRKLYQNGNFMEERYKRLNEIGFDFMCHQKSSFSGCCKIKSVLPLTPPPRLLSQEQEPSTTTTTTTTTIKLDETFERRLQELQKFKIEKGTLHVKSSDNRSLARWIQKQRRFYRLGKLEVDKINELNIIGFNWESTYSQKATDDKKIVYSLKHYAPPRANVPPLVAKKVTPLKMTVFTHHLDELIQGLGSGQMKIDRAIERLRNMRRLD